MAERLGGRTTSTTHFTRGVIPRLGYYVYILIDPKTGRPFYVGKGKGNRCFAHLDEANKTEADSTKDYEKLATIRRIGAGRVRIDILRHGLTEAEALRLESAAIDLLELTGLDNRVHGHGSKGLGRMTVRQVNAHYGAKRVRIDDKHRVVLITINRNYRPDISDKELYDATRQWWRVAAHRRDPASQRAPSVAMAVYSGVVYAVYRIDKWNEPSSAEVLARPTVEGRWSFSGKRDRDMERRYLLGNVSDYLRSAETGNWTQNPLRYVHCT